MKNYYFIFILYCLQLTYGQNKYSQLFGANQSSNYLNYESSLIGNNAYFQPNFQATYLWHLKLEDIVDKRFIPLNRGTGLIYRYKRFQNTNTSLLDYNDGSDQSTYLNPDLLGKNKGGNIGLESNFYRYQWGLKVNYNYKLKKSRALGIDLAYRDNNNNLLPGRYGALFNSALMYENKKDQFLFGYQRSNQSKASLITQEQADLAQNKYYNPNWGYLSNKERSTNETWMEQMYFAFKRNFQAFKKWDLAYQTLLLYQKENRVMMNWYDAKDPRPQYYKNLPSYAALINDSDLFASLQNQWTQPLQYDWNYIFQANSNNLYTVNNSEGLIQGNRAKYILMGIHKDLLQSQHHFNFQRRWNKSKINIGYQFNFQRNYYYQSVYDLLGSDFWMDYDRFAESDGVQNNTKQNNLSALDRAVYTGDKMGYNYYLQKLQNKLYLNYQWKGKVFEYYALGHFEVHHTLRNSFWANGKFPDNSKGKSKTIHNYNYNTQQRVAYKINGRNYLNLFASAASIDPSADLLFQNPEFTNFLNEWQNYQVYNFNLNYAFRHPKLKIDFALGVKEILNYSKRLRFYHDQYQNFVNYFVKNENSRNQYVHLGLKYEVFDEVNFHLMGQWNDFYYTNRPLVDVLVNNTNEVLQSDEVVYQKNFAVGNIPKLTLGAGVSTDIKGYRLEVNTVFTALNHVTLNPSRRSENVLNQYAQGDPQVTEILTQEQFDPAAILNFKISKNYKIGRIPLRVFFNVNGIPLTQNNKIMGMENLRYDPSRPTLFDNRYRFSLPTEFYLSLQFNF